jgi:hypothetical protein
MSLSARGDASTSTLLRPTAGNQLRLDRFSTAAPQPAGTHINSVLEGIMSAQHHHLTSRSLAGALAIAAIAAPAAAAQPQHTVGPGQGATPPDYDKPVVTHTIDGGFDAGSAAIGAGGAATALLLAAAGASAASHRRHRVPVGR